MLARLHDNGCEVRVDMGNTGRNWPDCGNEQRGFPWLAFGHRALESAEAWARAHGATEIIYTTVGRRDGAHHAPRARVNRRED